MPSATWVTTAHAHVLQFLRSVEISLCFVATLFFATGEQLGETCDHCEDVVKVVAIWCRG